MTNDGGDPVDPRIVQRATRLRAEFIAKFGREPNADEPLVFDPNSGVPRPFRHPDVNPRVVARMIATAVAPQIVHAYERTGLIVSTKSAQTMPPQKLREYQAAIEEYHAVQYCRRAARG
jgi:hypothetical protein